MEMIKYKVWFPGYRTSKTQSLQDEAYETVQVTTNLELALRHLRRAKGIRTLWIDALCINQADGEEKLMHIQRMDAIYANAWEVIVWLGGYHDSPESTCTAGHNGHLDCKQRQAIEMAVRTVDWLRTCRPAFVSEQQKRKEWIEHALHGLRSLSQRGWWTRLWVVQEVALAQGAARVQCGDYSCDFGDLCSALDLLASDLGPAGSTTHSGSRSPAWYVMASTVQPIAYSVFTHKRDLYSISEAIRAISDLDRCDFGQKPRSEFAMADNTRKLKFTTKLQYVLLKTAGRFSCFDDRDRLRAVIGISGGLSGTEQTILGKPGVPRFFIWGSGLCTAWTVYESTIVYSFGDLWVLWLIYTAVYWYWGVTMDTFGWDWTITQNKVVVKDDHREMIKYVEDGQSHLFGNYDSRASFFISLAEHLANETGFVLFLDAVSCDQSKKQDGTTLPSWVPDWTSFVADSASDHCIRTLTGSVRSPDFRICREKGELKVFGYARTVETITTYGKKDSRKHSARSPITGPRRSGVLENDCLATIGSRGKDGLEKDSLVRGHAALHDIILDVPGNFYHLVLRRNSRGQDGENRWSVVGLLLHDKKNKSPKQWASKQNGFVLI
ncbi:heterokaryon incompatibility protein-domain-containing protein [Rhypophila decipiens]|uniref:Heterokaryon incompatibility protein-domain-containing protein n=1 Tax=Rhypophila decipiens TaxID=261697 RepID=A0AAN6Y036_9PEZI|nr:heterokaryon incompatibility protein-domain-containing protein [Rhypophila decipiens]